MFKILAPLKLFKDILPYPFDCFIEFYLYLMILTIIFFIFRKIQRLSFRRVFVIWKDGTQNIRDYSIKDGRLQIRPAKKLVRKKSKAWTPKVSPKNVLPAKLTFGDRIKFWGMKQKDIIVAVEGAQEAVILKGIDLASKVGIKEASKLLSSKLFSVFTPQEAQDFINKAMAKAIVDRKMFSENQFYIFLVLMIIQTFVLLMIANKMGIF